MILSRATPAKEEEQVAGEEGIEAEEAIAAEAGAVLAQAETALVKVEIMPMAEEEVQEVATAINTEAEVNSNTKLRSLALLLRLSRT